MKRQLIAAGAVLLLVLPTCAMGKSTALELAQIQAERRAIVEATVAPAPNQAEEFWPIYWEYRGQVGLLNDRTAEVIEEFLAAEGSLSGDRAAAIVLEGLDIEKTRAALKQKYLKQLKDVLVPKQVARWYQTERKMDSVIRAELAAAIPFQSMKGHEGAEPDRAKLRSLREDLVQEVVQPSSDQEKPFWYSYRKYAKEMAELEDRVAELIDEYNASYCALNDQQALRMTKEAAEIDAARLKKMETTIWGLSATLTARQMLRLMQVEFKMNAMVDLALAIEIPFDQ